MSLPYFICIGLSRLFAVAFIIHQPMDTCPPTHLSLFCVHHTSGQFSTSFHILPGGGPLLKSHRTYCIFRRNAECVHFFVKRCLGENRTSSGAVYSNFSLISIPLFVMVTNLKCKRRGEAPTKLFTSHFIFALESVLLAAARRGCQEPCILYTQYFFFREHNIQSSF